MTASGSSTYNDSASGFIDVFRYFGGSTQTSESYRCSMNSIFRYENENPRIPIKVLYGVKTKVQLLRLKPLSNVRHIKQFTGHSFRIGNSKK